MSVELLHYDQDPTEPDIRESLLQIARDIILIERAVSIPNADARWVEWDANPRIFDPALGLRAQTDRSIARDDFQIMVAHFILPDDTKVRVERPRQDEEAAVRADPFLKYFFTAFQTFRTHPHRLCLDALAQVQQAATARRAALAEAARANFTVIDNRSSATIE